jgi:dual specificity tyrosine-phosphorylation-regulated kinase 2/3/4
MLDDPNDSEWFNPTKGRHIAFRFEVIDVLGTGAFGLVCRVYDHKHGATRGIKVIRRNRKCAKLAKSEAQILRRLRD